MIRAGIRPSTDGLRVEEEVRFRRALLESVSETSMEGILVLSNEGQVLSCNRRFTQLWDLAPDACALNTAQDILNSISAKLQSPTEFQQRFAHIENAAADQIMQLEMRLTDGRLFNAYSAPVRDDHGTRYGRVWFVRDVTDRKEMLAELADVAAHARCILWHADIEGEKDWERGISDSQPHPFRWKIRFQDEQAAQSVLPLDLTPGEPYVFAFGRSRDRLDQHRAYQTSADAFLSGASSYSQDYRCLDKHGTLNWIHEVVSVQRVGYGRWKAFGVCTNITERKRGEESLANLAAIVEWSHDAIIGTTLQGTVTTWNRGAERIFGYRAEEMIGRSVQILVPPERIQEQSAVLQRVARGEAVREFETERLAKCGRRVQLSLTVSPIRDAGGAVVGISRIASDISERKKAEAALRASEQRFSLFMRHLPGYAFMKDAQRRITFINDSHKSTMGWEQHRWSGKTVHELFPPDVAAVMEAHDREVLETKEPLQAFETIPHPDGDHVYLVSKFPIVDPASGEVLLGGICIDMTERMRAQDLVRYQKSALESVVEASRDGLLLVGEDGKWVSFNRRFAAMWGIPDEILATRSDERAIQFVRDKLHDPEGFLRRVQHYYDHPSERGRDRVPLRDGRVFERDTLPVIGPDGTYYGRVWFFHDATEEEHARERLRSLAWETTKTEEAERRRIAATLHDHVGQMLIAMRMKLEGLSESGPTKKDTRVGELRALVDDVISATRTLTVELSPPILYEFGLFPALRWLGMTMIEPRGLRFHCHIDAEARVDDESRLILFRAVRELLMNVVKHARAQSVAIRASESEAEADGQLRITVEDDGVGFDSSATGMAGRSNSFGLFSIRERLQYLGGSLVIDSGIGQGTRATLIVPATAKKREINTSGAKK